jgi:hypothetical protein
MVLDVARWLATLFEPLMHCVFRLCNAKLDIQTRVISAWSQLSLIGVSEEHAIVNLRIIVTILALPSLPSVASKARDRRSR